jgi:hypothetical protein
MAIRPYLSGLRFEVSGAWWRSLLLNLLALGLLALATVGFFWRILFAGAWMPAGGGDLAALLYPTYHLAAQSLKSGVIPLWNPYLWGGAPFVADIQASLFYPINLIYFLLAPQVTYRGVMLLSIFHFWLAGVGMYLFLRSLLPGRRVEERKNGSVQDKASFVPAHLRTSAFWRAISLPSLFGALAFMFSDYFIVHFGNLNLIAQAAWLPFIFLFYHRSLSERRPGLAVWAGVFLAIAATAGHIQPLLIITLGLGWDLLYHLGLTFVRWRSEKNASSLREWSSAKHLLRDCSFPLATLAITLLVGLGLAAFVLLPAYEMVTYTPRADYNYAQASAYSLSPAQLVGLLVPNFFGRDPATHWGVWDRVEVGYVGVLTLLLALFALLAATRVSESASERVSESASQRVGEQLPHRPGSRPGLSQTPYRGSPGPRGAATCAAPTGAGRAGGTGRDRDRCGSARESVFSAESAYRFASLAVFSLLLAMGGYTVLHGWLYGLLPGLGGMRAPARFVFLMDFALAALAALGLDVLMRGSDEQVRPVLGRILRAAPWVVGAVTLFALPLAFYAVIASQDKDPVIFARVSAAANGLVFFAGLLIVGVGLFYLRQRGMTRPAMLGALAVGLLFFDLASLGSGVDVGYDDPSRTFDHPAVIQFLKSDPDLYRIDSRTGVWHLWQPDTSLLHRIFDVGGLINPLNLSDYDRYWNGIPSRSSPLYDFLNAKYVIAAKDVTLDWEKFVPVFDGDPALNVYLNRRALPRALVVHRAISAPDHEAAYAALHTRGFDPATTVVVEGGDALAGNPSSAAAIRFDDFGLNEIQLHVETPVDAYLVLSEVWYPGWRATVDGVPVPVLRANYAFRALRLRPGQHQVRLTFAPRLWTIGLAISGLTLLALMGWGGRRSVHKKLQQRHRVGVLH